MCVCVCVFGRRGGEGRRGGARFGGDGRTKTIPGRLWGAFCFRLNQPAHSSAASRVSPHRRAHQARSHPPSAHQRACTPPRGAAPHRAPSARPPAPTHLDYCVAPVHERHLLAVLDGRSVHLLDPDLARARDHLLACRAPAAGQGRGRGRRRTGRARDRAGWRERGRGRGGRSGEARRGGCKRDRSMQEGAEGG